MKKETELRAFSPVRNKPTRARYVILVLLFFITAINYIDRASVSIVGPSIQHSLNISPALLGIVFSAFSWTYTGMQIPGGLILDKFGSKRTYGISLFVWSVFTGVQAFATSFGFLFGCRLLIGIAESPAFPANNRIVTTWFPRRERAFATGVYTAGEYVGLAFATPVLFWVLTAFDWRAVFISSGVLGIVFSIFWFKMYHEPNGYRKVNREELDYIKEGGGLTEVSDSAGRISWADFVQLLKYRKLVGLYIGQFAVASTLFFFLTWFPTYLAEAKHMAFLKVGFAASIPYIAAFFGVLFGGFWSDGMMKRGVSVNVARKTPVILGLLLTGSIVLANVTDSAPAVLTILSIASFAQGMSNISWTMLSEVAPSETIGLAGGVFSFFANMAGIITPLIIGFIVSATGSYNGAILFVGAVAFIGAFSYIFIVGKVERIKLR
ncbi:MULTISPECIES: MFS transporter [Bacillus amyloliquefaciens group]|uniref:MFS transporter n=1 Tax=Bacillus amyloliquefaciens group TaxID=1938374 RepID=UPI0003873876|nr:D-galactonate transporter [Bacillus velezensis]MBC2599144.1 MFS transporter [Bacillus velezensis]MBU5240237.1 MFS transporter [Bacillus velezensis]MCM3371752.1 MFS transporter [Bacillus velezensis]QDF54717.1 D-galactonate transporter [Bacillus velezensis]CDG24602.1 D-galactonate transporter [Bacillus velezensis UCMB5113]